MKTCNKCGETKPFTEFHKSARDGIQSSCKACRCIAQAAYSAANPDKKKASDAKWKAKNQGYKAKWKAANPAKVKAHSAKWYASNPERHKAASAAWNAANKERVREMAAARNKANPEANRIHQHNRRAREREAVGKLSKDLAAKLFKLQRGKCACGCKQPLGDDYHRDHIMPLALGGSNTDDNIQLLRQRCNNQKYAKDPIDFMQQRGFLL